MKMNSVSLAAVCFAPAMLVLLKTPFIADLDKNPGLVISLGNKKCLNRLFPQPGYRSQRIPTEAM